MLQHSSVPICSMLFLRIRVRLNLLLYQVRLGRTICKFVEDLLADRMSSWMATQRRPLRLPWPL